MFCTDVSVVNALDDEFTACCLARYTKDCKEIVKMQVLENIVTKSVIKIRDMKDYFKMHPLFDFLGQSLAIILKISYIRIRIRAVSSAGRALEWHSRGQRFDPATVHRKAII